MKTNLMHKIILTLLVGNMVYMNPVWADGINIKSSTSATGNTYSTGGISKTKIVQSGKDQPITLGQTINFGNYQQSLASGGFTVMSSGNNNDKQYEPAGSNTYNTENVNWIVVEDKGSGKFNLVSTKIVDQHNFDEIYSTKTWTDAAIRTWMNGDMFTEMFSGKEQNLIQSQVIETKSATSQSGWDSGIGGTTTEDKVYLLSIQELKQYFNQANYDPTYGWHDIPSATGKKAWGAGLTDFAKGKSVWVENDGGVTAIDGSNNAFYILRSPTTAYNPDFNIRASHTGGFIAWTDKLGWLGVRPGMQIDTSSLLFTSVGGSRDAKGNVTIKGKYMGAGSYDTSGGKHEFVKTAGGQAVKFETMTSNSILDLTFYDSTLTKPTLKSIKLDGANIEVEYKQDGSNAFDIAGMVATGDNSGYTPVGWSKMAIRTNEGTAKTGFNNFEAGEYSLLVMAEEGTGTSFVGDAVVVEKIIVDGSHNLTYKISDGGSWNGSISVGATNTLEIEGTSSIIGTVDFVGGSTLKVDGAKITDTAAISDLTGATVASGSKLYVKNAEKDTQYKILAGSNLDVQGWTTDDDMLGLRYGLTVDTDNIVNEDSEFSIQFKADLNVASDIANIIANLPSEGKATEWIDAISVAQTDTEIQGNTVNTMANMAQLVNVRQGTVTATDLIMDNIIDNIGAKNRPILHWQSKDDKKEGNKLQNTAADKNEIKTEPIALAKKEDMNLTSSQEQQQDLKYHKEVWGRYIHVKQDIDGMEAGSLEQDGTAYYNGVTVGADLWNGKHGFGGAALTYVDGNVNSGQRTGNVKNDADYRGINIYNRQDIGKFSVQYGMGYTHSSNEVTMSTQGAEDVTAKPKVDIYSADCRVEEPFAIAKHAVAVPYAGLRCLCIRTKDYCNNLGLNYDVNNQRLLKMPLGVSFRQYFPTIDGWKVNSSLDLGYEFNFGDKEGEQHIAYAGASDTVDFELADSGRYFIRPSIQAEYQQFVFEIGYRFSRSKNTKYNKWNINTSVEF